MDNVKNDKYYIDKILVDLEFLIEHTKNLTKEDIENGVEPVTVRVQALADFSVNLRAVLWVESFNQRGSYLSDLRKAVKLQFDKEGIEIPYPYQNTIIHTKEK